MIRGMVSVLLPLVIVGRLAISRAEPPIRVERSAHLVAGREELGRRLFFDRRLSRDSSISCASCHQPSHGFAEPRKLSFGIGEEARIRNTPSLANIGLALSFNWDGSRATLEEQVLGVFQEDGDMGMPIHAALLRIATDREYVEMFRQVFGRAPDLAGFADALAAFQRTLIYSDSRFDRFWFGGDSTALTAEERRGWEVFRGPKTNCSGCHVPTLTSNVDEGRAPFFDHRFHNLGVGYSAGEMRDLGRYLVTGVPRDWGAFRTPSLRNVALTAPYMHDGSLESLEDVVAFYVRGES
ncbi:MAG: cytochrome-c peroxidase [Gemmatimonadetes bacterium]|nr:cytochrome-c peroxidase [Gemmatimonadota bacterium]